MTQSVTGVGLGACNKFTTKELAILANGPSIMLSGRAEATESIEINPPMTAITVTFSPLPGSHTNYNVVITGINTGHVYVATMTDDDDGNFSEFTAITESEGTCMYVIINNGIRPTV